MSEGKVRVAWQSAVGPAAARATVVRLTGTGELRVTAESEHWRREIVRSAPVIRARLAGLLGADRITRITFATKGSTS